MVINFSNKVAIITGAGLGLGRSHALELSRRGAKIVVNDLSSENANAVVKEIVENGGAAIAAIGSVTDDAAISQMVSQTMEKWGRIDILVNNAGILRDKSFAKMAQEDFDIVLDVHLLGTFKPIKAVWEIMKSQNYGRIIVTTSSSGLYGNFGQSNYGAAKLALVGLMNTLKIEGRKKNIHINAISPVAATQMTQDLMPPQFLEMLKPEYVSPAVAYLCSEEAPNGVILSAGAGTFAMAKIIETKGINFKGDEINAENIAKNFAAISDSKDAEAYLEGNNQTQNFLHKAIS
ncbi:MAG: SDR family NAD(P)-dependent oxidoreductase [Caulobacterales bacterium]|nr:SDR family NAD(P)-dependent oxidoreductase [Caulobacterales bacterium]MCA0373241.1 SDR family NAD(P)-dependent oxidoreductase [Pseudomonadota bacterium]